MSTCIAHKTDLPTTILTKGFLKAPAIKGGYDGREKSDVWECDCIDNMCAFMCVVFL